MDIATLYRMVAGIRSTLRLVRRGLVRLGAVKTVDLQACTIVVEYDDTDEDDQPVESEPMPWFQRSTEHHPPVVGDHVLVLDPSLGMGSAIAIVGWPSTAKPAPENAGEKHVIHKQYDSLIQVDDQGLCKLNNCEIDVDGNTMIPETLEVKKATTLDDTLDVSGNTTINADLTVTSGGPQISASASGVELAGGLDFVALSQKVDLNFTTLKTILTTAFTSVGAGVAANGALGAAQMASFVPVPTAATKVKAT